eukprot:NODE_31714_length_391_cov_1.280303.p5 GENE.NODE_31714_length_391_cov_1.280303~~NODE_31714_length_391_cov_1.280303.p5  ORF type:complete len:64 (-),score=13.53 NODE_31714_length_391_cov_1.280303:114-305(-)
MARHGAELRGKLLSGVRGAPHAPHAPHPRCCGSARVVQAVPAEPTRQAEISYAVFCLKKKKNT